MTHLKTSIHPLTLLPILAVAACGARVTLTARPSPSGDAAVDAFLDAAAGSADGAGDGGAAPVCTTPVGSGAPDVVCVEPGCHVTVLAKGDLLGGFTLGPHGLYWAEGYVANSSAAATHFVELPLDGGPVRYFAPGGPSLSMWPGLAADDSFLYASFCDGKCAGSGTVRTTCLAPVCSSGLAKYPLDGGAREVVTSFNSSCGAAAIAVDNDNVYYTHDCTLGGVFVQDVVSLETAPKAGGSAVTIADYVPAFSLTADALIFSRSGRSTSDLSIVERPLDGGAITVLGTQADAGAWYVGIRTLGYYAGGSGGQAFAASDTGAYWADYSPSDAGGTTIFAAALDGGVPATLVAGLAADIVPLAIDATNLYYVASSTLFRVPRSGGTPVSLVTGILQDDPLVAVDDSGVYIGMRGMGPTAAASGCPIDYVPGMVLRVTPK